MKLRSAAGFLLVALFVAAEIAIFFFFSFPPRVEHDSDVCELIQLPADHAGSPRLPETSRDEPLSTAQPENSGPVPPTPSTGRNTEEKFSLFSARPSSMGIRLPRPPLSATYFRRVVDRYTTFGTVPSSRFRDSNATEAACECYDGSCTLHMTNVVMKRVSTDRIVFRAADGGHSKDALQRILKKCRNAFPLCDMSEPSIFCNPGITFGLSTKRHRLTTFGADNQHVLVTLRALRGELFHDLIAPRGLLLNHAVANISREFLSSGAPLDASDALRTAAVLLMSDFKSRTVTNSDSTLQHLEALVGLPHPQYLHKNVEISARFVSVANRIMSFEGRVFRRMADCLGVLRGAVELEGWGDPAPRSVGLVQSADKATDAVAEVGGSEEAADTDRARPSLLSDAQPAAAAVQPWNPSSSTEPIALLARSPALVGGRWRGISRRIREGLAQRLSAVTSRPVIVHEATTIEALPLPQIVKWTTNTSLIVCEESSFLVFLAFGRPGTTWVAIADFASRQHVDTMRLHLRTWLLRADQRLIFYIKEMDLEAGLDVLVSEVGGPYADSVSFITHDRTVRCDSFSSCASAWDYTLIADARGSFEKPPSLRD
jgi:hypothetical protein